MPTPLEALKRAVLPALRRPPCLVSFSGGRDSSLILSVAAQVASEEGLAAPVPTTLRYPSVPDTDESSYQELVVSSLGLADWLKLEIEEELDFLGPFARRVLRRHGVLHPANAHSHAPLFEQAAGGSLLTGWGGDDVFAAWRWQRAAGVLGRRVRPEPRDYLRVAAFVSPLALRRLMFRRRAQRYSPEWLHPPVRKELVRALAEEDASQPRRWDRWLGWIERRRYVAVVRESLSLIAADVGAVVDHPFLDPGFLAAMADAGGRVGWGPRTETMTALFSGVLPGEVLSRPGKARFAKAFTRRHTRQFAESWSGRGLDLDDLIDTDALRAEWAKPEPDLGSMGLLQAAWLATEARASKSDSGLTGSVPATAG